MFSMMGIDGGPAQPEPMASIPFFASPQATFEQPEQPEQPEQSEQYEQREQREQPEQSEQREQPEQSEQSEQSEQYEQREQPEQREQSEQPEQREQSEQPEQYEQREQPEQLTQFLQPIRLSSAFCAASCVPKYVTDDLLPLASSSHTGCTISVSDIWPLPLLDMKRSCDPDAVGPMGKARSETGGIAMPGRSIIGGSDCDLQEKGRCGRHRPR